MEKENKIAITVTSLSGNYTDEFNVHQTLRHVMDKAFHELHIKPAHGEVWELSYHDVVLNPEQTIEQAKLPNHAKLKLAPHEGGGGGAWMPK